MYSAIYSVLVKLCDFISFDIKCWYMYQILLCMNLLMLDLFSPYVCLDSLRWNNLGENWYKFCLCCNVVMFYLNYWHSPTCLSYYNSTNNCIFHTIQYLSLSLSLSLSLFLPLSFSLWPNRLGEGMQFSIHLARCIAPLIACL
jgi:hypothetical protein